MLPVLAFFCVALLALLWMVLPGESDAQQRAAFWGVNFAHRGLHSKDKSIPENSIAAFCAAVDEGYGIELDLRLSKDGQVVVFHDENLQRLCGVPGQIAQHSYQELQAFTLCGSGQKIPLLQDVLQCVGSSVPLLIELKQGNTNTQLCAATWRILRQYDGDICVQSFHPGILRWFKRHAPGLLRGQLAARPAVLKKGLAGICVGLGFTNFLGRPHFIAYQKGPRPWPVRFMQRLAMRFVWLAGPEDDSNMLEGNNDAVIFEFYKPLPRYLDTLDKAKAEGGQSDNAPGKNKHGHAGNIKQGGISGMDTAQNADAGRRVSAYFKEKNLPLQAIFTGQDTSTVEKAAKVLGVQEGQIAKSLAVSLPKTIAEAGVGILVLAGSARLDNQKYKAAFATKAKLLGAGETLAQTGFAIGGVCPFALPQGVAVFLDESLKQYGTVYPAAGTKDSAVRVKPAQLAKYTSGRWVDVCKGE